MSAVDAAAPSGTSVLVADRVTKEFGGLVAVNDVYLDVPRHSIVSLIGPNGAGKTTLFNMLTGLYKPTAGRILLGERDITHDRPDQITSLGVARTFQNIRLFAAMTAVENVMIGRHARMNTGVFGSIFRPPWVRNEEKAVRARARELLRYVGLREDTLEQLAKNLSYGDQRRVEIARALASEPTVLLLDEPSMGLAPILVQRIYETISEINRQGVAILLVEQNANYALDVSKRGYVLETGRIALSGESEQLRGDPEVQRAYLGA